MARTSSKRILQLGALAAFFVLIVAYGFFGSHNLIFGIKIENVNIDDGARMENAIMQVTGNADNAIELTLNGREISINENGDFNETIAVLAGYNIVNIKAKDKFGYVDEKNYQLIH